MQIRLRHRAAWVLLFAVGARADSGSAAARADIDRSPALDAAIYAPMAPTAGGTAWLWTLGHEQRWVCTSSRTGKVSGAAAIEWSQQERVVVLQKVTATGADGSADLEFTILSARVEIASHLGTSVLDTAAPNPSTTVDPAGVLRKLVDKKVTCHVDAAGHATAAGGGKALLDELKSAYAKDPKITAIVAQFAGTFDDEALRIRFDRVLGILPTVDQIRAGGEWTSEGGKTCDIDLPGLGTLSLTDRHTMETPPGEPDATRIIKTTTTATLAKSKAGESPLAAVYVISLEKAQGASTVTFNIAQGELVGSEATMSYSINFAPKPGNAPPPPMTQVIEQKVRVERESK